MATIKEIAKECNVSIATVSNILNNKGKVGDETRRMVTEKIKKLNYVPNAVAKNLKQRTTRTIGIITEDLTVFNAPEIVDGADEHLEERGYNFLLGNLRIHKKYGKDFWYHDEFKSNLYEELSIMRANQVAGIIYVSAHSRDLSGILKQDEAMPIVLVYGFTRDKNIPAVNFNDEDAAYTVVNSLLKEETNMVGVIAGEKNSLHTRERLLGFQKAMFQKGILYNPEMVYYGDWSRKHGCDTMPMLLEQGAKAVFSMNDSMAAGVYDYALERKLVIGRDILIGGIGSEISEILYPRLTTVEMPLFEMGHKAAEIILDIIEGKTACQSDEFKIKGKLINHQKGSI